MLMSRCAHAAADQPQCLFVGGYSHMAPLLSACPLVAEFGTMEHNGSRQQQQVKSALAANICTLLGKEICTSQGTISKAELLVGYLYLRGKIEVEVQ